MSEFLMPSLGADMEAGKLVEWLVKPGAPVKRGDVVAVVETQKGAIEIEIFEDGIFERSLVDVGATVPVGTALAEISHAGEPVSPDEKVTVAPPEPETPKPAAPDIQPPPPVATARTPEQAPDQRTKVSPVARRLAAQSGINLSKLSGTGPKGTVVLADVEAVIGKVAETPARTARAAQDPMSGMRAAIAAAMTRSKRDIPHYYLSNTIDLSHAQEWLAAYNAERQPADRLVMGALFTKAVALAAKKYPEFNGHYEDGTFSPSKPVHAGVAINIRGGGLVAPAIHDAETLELDALMAAMRDLVARVRMGRFRGSELSDPTLTISSLGERGVESLYGVIYPPQVAIVGFGMPVIRPWAAGGMVGPRQVVTVTLAGDHRVSDGHRGALFLNAIENQLLEPEAL